MTRICDVQDCGNTHKARGYCGTHYARLRANGSPFVTHTRNKPWERVDSYYEVASGGCWEWLGRTSNGYGRSYDPDSPYLNGWAHRVAYKIAKGPISKGWEIDHTCQNTICVNPDHLDAVTKEEHRRRTLARAGKYALQEQAGALRLERLTYREIAERMEIKERHAVALVGCAAQNGLVDKAALPVHPPRNPDLTADERAIVINLHRAGVPTTEIARRMGRKPKQLRTAIKKAA